MEESPSTFDEEGRISPGLETERQKKHGRGPTVQVPNNGDSLAGRKKSSKSKKSSSRSAAVEKKSSSSSLPTLWENDTDENDVADRGVEANLSGDSNDAMPLMDLWRRDHSMSFSLRRKKQKAGGASSGKGGNDEEGGGTTSVRRRVKKRHQLFRHQLVLPDNYAPMAVSPAVAPSANINPGGTEGTKQKGRDGAKGPKSDDVFDLHQLSLWDHCWSDDYSSDEDDEAKGVDIDVVGADGGGEPMEIRSTRLPLSSDMLVWENGADVGAGADMDEAAPRRLRLSLRERIARADMLVQSRVPSCIEFRARRWVDSPVVGASAWKAVHDGSNGTVAGTATNATQNADNGEDNDARSWRRPVDYREERSFFVMPPRSKFHASSNAAREFLAALHAAATDSAGSSSEATAVVMRFLSIIKESRENGPGQGRGTSSPFFLMKKVWKLILSVVSSSSVQAGVNIAGTSLANQLAAKFDNFLPEGYSMLASNMLLLEICSGENDDGQKGAHIIQEGCARTREVFRTKKPNQGPTD